jgi:plastocyanin
MRMTLILAAALITAACTTPQRQPAEPTPRTGEDSASTAEPADERSAPETADPVEPAEDETRPPRPDDAEPERPAETATPPAPSEPIESAAETEAPAASQPEPAPDMKAGVQESIESDPQARPERNRLAISGRLMLSGGDAETSEAVVYFLPDAGAADRPQVQAREIREIVTRDKTLSPTVLAVSPGTQVRFPNDDPILHNLFSVSPENGFDLGVYGPGESPAVEFERPGVVNIYCNVHHDMHAHVLVVDTAWHTSPDSEGRFELAGLPPGPGVLHVWHRQSERWSRPIELPLAAPIDVTLPVTKPKLPPHRDKSGLPYNRRDRDPYR